MQRRNVDLPEPDGPSMHITSPAFNGQKVLGSILFERTMDGEVKGKPVPAYLWEDRGVVPFVKVDKGLAAEKAAQRADRKQVAQIRRINLELGAARARGDSVMDRQKVREFHFALYAMADQPTHPVIECLPGTFRLFQPHELVQLIAGNES